MPAHLLEALTLCALLGCVPQPPPPASRTSARGGVRLATWNVHDLFDATDRVAPPGELDEVPSEGEVEGKLARVATVLARLDADLVLLQEVENLPLAERLASRSGYAETRLLEGFDPRGIDVAVLSRLPIERYVSHLGEVGRDGRPLWSRDCVELHATAGGERLVLVGTHLVSRLTDPEGARRREQAARLREIADAAVAEGAIVVAGGDLNDEPASGALEPLLADGRWIDPLRVVGLHLAWTWTGGGGGARLDYLLLPKEEAWRAWSATIADGADVAAASDHRPVVIELGLWK